MSMSGGSQYQPICMPPPHAFAILTDKNCKFISAFQVMLKPAKNKSSPVLVLYFQASVGWNNWGKKRHTLSGFYCLLPPPPPPLLAHSYLILTEMWWWLLFLPLRLLAKPIHHHGDSCLKLKVTVAGKNSEYPCL